MKLSTLLVICIISNASSFMHESVFFHKVGQFSMSRSRWLVSFVIDLGVYENFLTRLSQSIDNASNLVDKVIDKYQSPPTKDYQTVFEGFKNEIGVIQDMHKDIVYSFNEYKLLREPRTRNKRGVFNFIGDVMGSLFGVLTSTDIEKIQRNINTLAQNQLDLAHAFQESISVLNVTRLEVKENRQKINDIIDTIGDIEDTIINISNQMEQQLNTLERVVLLTAYVTRVIEEIKNAITRSMYFYLHFQIQVQAIIMQRLSPSTVSADNLRNVLLSIRERLPKTIGLPFDPRTHLFEYFQYLRCLTLFQNNRVIITIDIPLMEFTQRYELYKAISLPAPLLGTARAEKKELLAYYKLESSYLAVNPERTQYILLNEGQAIQCSDPMLKICNIKKPIRNINVGQSCVISNFMEDEVSVKRNCDVWLQHSRLPTAKFLANDVYLIITKHKVTFNIACDDKGSDKKKFTVKPPYGFLNLHKNCIATSRAFSLTGYYERHSFENTTSPVNYMLKHYNFSNFKVWDKVKQFKLETNLTLDIPRKLNSLEEFPLDSLLGHLDQLRPMEDMSTKPFPTWGYVVVTIGIITIFVLSLVVYCKYKKQLFSKLLHSKSKTSKRKQMTIMSGDATINDESGNQRLTDDATCMSSLLDEGQRKSNSGTSSQDIEMVISKKKFPVLDSQIFQPIPSEREALSEILLNKIIAEVLTLISFIWLTVSVAGAEWVDVKFRYYEDETWNWGIWRTCNTIDGDETVCMEADWVTVCLVFSIIALILSLIAAVCGVLGLLVAKSVQKKRKFYTVAGGLMCFVAALEFMVVIIFPVKFGDNIVTSELVMRWDYDWTYGFAWGAFIFSAGAAVFFLLPNGDKQDSIHSFSERNSKDTTP